MITSEEISIDLDHYNYQYRVLTKGVFTNLLKRVFNQDLNQSTLTENYRIRFEIIRLINSLKTRNLDYKG